jgi:hypothetical protein
VSKTLRDAQRFGFTSLEKLNAEGEKLVTKGIDLASGSLKFRTYRGV